MNQTKSDTTAKQLSPFADRLSALHAAMKEQNLDAYLVLAGDEHLNEYVPDHAQRRAWLTNFTGSAGDALIGLKESYLFADSRYHEQADLEVDDALYKVSKVGRPEAPSLDGILTKWLETKQSENGPRFRFGIDIRCMPMQMWDKFQKLVSSANGELVPLTQNLIDPLWKDAPAIPTNPVKALPLSATGESTQDKLDRVRDSLKKSKTDLLPITRLDQIAWLLNLRGSDIPYNPLFIAYAILDANEEKLLLFSDEEHFSPAVKSSLESTVKLYPYNAYEKELSERVKGERAVLLDARHTTQLTVQITQQNGGQCIPGIHPIEMMKAVKNKTEISAMQTANLRASRGKIRAWHWLEKAIADKKTVTEASFRDVIEAFYAEEPDFAGLSFNTISGAGANGSIVHYGTPSTEKQLENGELFLIDSGCQFSIGGTTDDTRTWFVGEKATDKQRLRYTEVLKAHVNVAMQQFPSGTDGARLDGICRSTLWQNGLDYGHGTGHGVGAYLNVHEGPNGIHRLASTPLEPNMITSIEPGFYESGWGGIRLENLYRVIQLDQIHSDAPWYGFESLTWIPFDPKLTDQSRLSAEQKAWLKTYHERTLEQIAPTLSNEESNWLKSICKFFNG